MTQTPCPPKVESAADKFLAAAFNELTAQHVLPRPRFQRHLQVGRDYFGPDLMALPEYRELEAALVDAYPDHFTKSVLHPDYESPEPYIFSLLEGLVSDLTQQGESYQPNMPAVEEWLGKLAHTLDGPETEVACCRLLSHTATRDDGPVEIGDMAIAPSRVAFDLEPALRQAIPGAPAAFGNRPPFVFEPPMALVIARGKGRDPFEAIGAVSAGIDRFLLLVRLLFAGTVESLYEVRGESSAIRRYSPELVTHNRSGVALIRRTTRLGADDARPIADLGALLDSLTLGHADMVATSFDMAP